MLQRDKPENGSVGVSMRVIVSCAVFVRLLTSTLPRATHRTLDAEEADEYFTERDVDEDGHVTWSEYLQGNYGFSAEQTDDWERDESPEMQQYATVSALGVRLQLAS